MVCIQAQGVNERGEWALIGTASCDPQSLDIRTTYVVSRLVVSKDLRLDEGLGVEEDMNTRFGFKFQPKFDTYLNRTPDNAAVHRDQPR